jgi:N-acetylmuramoyl-L-alanine amidase
MEKYTDCFLRRLWLEIDKGYRTEKTDPGKDFIDTIRKSTANLN